MVEVKTRYGTIAAPDVRTDVIGRFLQHYGEWSWDEATFVASILPDAARVLDVGAFLGTFGLGLLQKEKTAFICFVEANPAIIPYLKRNVERNASVPSAVVEAMVGDIEARPHQGRAHPLNFGSTSFADAAAGDVVVEEPAAATTLSLLRQEHGPFDLIKLDVEGMEYAILEDDSEFLSRGETTLWIECNEDIRSIQVADLVLAWGVPVYYFASPSHNPDNLRGTADAIYPMAYEAGLLVAPKVPPKLDSDLARHHCILEPIWSSEDLRKALWRTPRWGLPEWEGCTAERLAALAAHAIRGDDYDTYLTQGWRPGNTLSHRFTKLEEEYRVVETMALERLDALMAAQDRYDETEKALRLAETMAIDRLEQVDAEKKLSADTAHRLAELEEKYRQVEMLATERLDQMMTAEKKCGDMETARLDAERLAIQRLDAIEAEQQRIRDLAAECEDMKNLQRENSDRIQRLQNELQQEKKSRQGAELAAAVSSAAALDRLSLLGDARERAAAKELHYAATEEASRQIRCEIEDLTAKLHDTTADLNSRLSKMTEDREKFSLDLKAEERRNADLEARLIHMAAEKEQAESRANAVQYSTTWRLAGRAHRLFQGQPNLHRMMKLSLGAAAAIRRKRRETKQK